MQTHLTKYSHREGKVGTRRPEQRVSTPGSLPGQKRVLLPEGNLRSLAVGIPLAGGHEWVEVEV